MDWMMIWKTVLIGIVEGLTEFLPVSSTGHIILAEQLLGFEGPPGKVFEIVIQLGAILAVCVLYHGKIRATVSGVFRRDKVSLRFAMAVIVAFLPAAVVGVTLHKYIKALLDKPIVVATALIVGGILILLIEKLARRPRIKSLDDVDWKTALVIGLCQCLAMVPGVSRSAATIMGARIFRVDRATAAEFSFFLAIPTMLGATVYELYKKGAALSGSQGLTIGIGFIVSFVIAYVVIRQFLIIVARYGLTPFGWYRIALGTIGLVGMFLLG